MEGVKSEEVIDKMPKSHTSANIEDKISKILAFRFYALSTLQHSNFILVILNSYLI